MFMLAVNTADKSSQLFAQLLPWLLVLLAAIVVGGALIFLARRYIHGGGSPAGGFTLHDLREMHRAGEISDEQFERAKALMIGRIKPAEPGRVDGDAQPPGNRVRPEE